jgi:hypothetical protein
MRLRAMIAVMVAAFLVSFLWNLLPPPGQSSRAARAAPHVMRATPHLMSGLTQSLASGGMPTGVVGVEASFAPAGVYLSSTPGGGPPRSDGTGFVIADSVFHGKPQVLVATAAHVLGPAGSTGLGLSVFVPGSAQPVPARLIASSSRLDVALLDAPGLAGIPAVPLAGGATPTGTALPGGWIVGEIDCVRGAVWAFQSFPVPLAGDPLTTATGREGDFVQIPTPAALPGCSGGPLTAYTTLADGERPAVIGLLTAAGLEPTGIFFIPASAIQSLLNSVERPAGAVG